MERMAKNFGVQPEQALDIFNWELSQLEKVNHNNCVSLVGVLQHPTQPALAMELCDGALDDPKCLNASPYQLWCWAWEMCSGVAYLHSLGLVHR